LEDGEALGIVPNPDNLKGKRESTVISDEERNSVNSLQSNDQEEFFEGQSSVNSTSRAGSLSSFHPISHAELYNNEILYFGKVDLSEKGLCEGFRVNLGKLPQNNPNIPHNLTWEHFSHVHHLVDSSSCHIYTAFWDDLPVVLKLIKAERITSPVAVAEFEMEENILSRIRHPNIVRLLGSGTVPRKFLVLELLSGGSLSHSLGLRPDSQNQTWCKKFSFLETLRLAYDLSRALHYLHTEWSNSIHIIHRDIKPDNIGWTTDGHLKIFDFGLCVAVRAQREKTEQYRLTGNTGTLRYMAPEVVLGRSYNQTVDAYSFGILIWQVATGKIPFREMGKKPYFDRVVIGGQRPKLEPNWPMGFCNLLKVCWHEDKNLRPSFQKIMAELEILIKAEEDQVQKQENHLINRCSNLVLSLCLMTRPIVLFLVLGLFILALIVIIALNDTVSGSVLGMVSSFVIYAILMSYLKIWPTMTNLRRSRQFRANSLDMIEHFKRQSSPVPGGAGGGGESLQSLNNSSPVNGMGGSGVSHAIGESNLSVNRRHPSSAAAAVDHDDIELQAKPLTIVETSYSFNPLNRSVKRNGSISMV
jgi:serine/threonine protein kinase